MPKFNVFGYTTKKWCKTVEANDSDEADEYATETWDESDVYDGDTEVVNVVEIEE